MIQRSDIQSASPEVRARAKRFRAFERGKWVYVMTEPDKDDRACLFNGQTVECFSADTGEQCPANVFENVCCHCVAADRRKRINAKSRATRARKNFRVIAA